MKQSIQLAENLFSYSQELRRDFHQHPELGFQEKYSSSRIVSELDKMNVFYQKGLADTGVLAQIQGEKPGKTVLLRFDMDALPITEMNKVEYASRNPGCMHACGHDGHMAIGLTCAKILSGMNESFPGTIAIVFQPAEEGLGGAERMIKEGLLQNLKPDYAVGIHIWNEKPLGWLGISPGPIMAGADFFEITIIGKGGHGAIPENTQDPILASAQIITALQSIISRNVSPKDTAVLSITQISGGETYNVIPGEVSIKGTIRSFDKKVRFNVVEHLELIVKKISEGMGCSGSVKFIMTDPPTVNDEYVTNRIRKAAIDLFTSAEIDSQYRSMGSEDMAYFLEKIPGCYIYIGSKNTELGLIQGHHHPEFNFDEQVLPKAAALMVAGAIELLNS